MAPRAALYARVSTGHQDLGLQLDELRLVAGQRGWTIAGEHVDQMSGARDRRPGLDGLLDQVRRGKVERSLPISALRPAFIATLKEGWAWTTP